MEKELYMVVGVNGEGSSVWPEDFDIAGVFPTLQEAQKCSDQLNKENGRDEDGEWEEGEEYDYFDNDSASYSVVNVPYFEKYTKKEE